MAFKPPPTQQMTLAGPAGSLEALLEEPAGDDPAAAAVVCHPHPLHEGTMHNKVVHTLARGFQRLGLATVRFNFRGVGRSEGAFAEGVGETDDAIAVLDWAAGRWPGTPLWLGGFSFGAMVALRATVRREVAQLVTIAPAVQRLASGQFEQPQCPWLLIQGDRDELVDCEDVIEWVNRLEPGPEVVILPEVDHFFHGRLSDLRETVVANLRARVGP